MIDNTPHYKLTVDCRCGNTLSVEAPWYDEYSEQTYVCRCGAVYILSRLEKQEESK